MSSPAFDSVVDITSHRAFLSTLERHIKQAFEHRRYVALLLCQLNDFRSVKIKHGYATGDKVIRETFERLEDISRKNDCLFRLGPCEFALVLPFLAGPMIAEIAANKVNDTLREVFVTEPGGELHLMPKIGVAVSDGGLMDTNSFALLAENALQQAKGSSDAISICHRREDSYNDNDLDTAMWQAIENSEFELFLQPQLCMSNATCVSFESLIRWQYEGKYIPPDRFITRAEKSDLIHPLTKWTISNALRQLANLPSKYGDLRTSVNISGACFSQDVLVSQVASALRIWDIDPARVTLEVTETVFMEDLSRTQDICAQLREELGVKISIDDFGTGFSSFESFKHIHADELKIDKSFVQGVLTDKRDKHIVQCMIDLAKGANLETVVEGVENIELLIELSKMGADYAQGYFIAKPFSEHHQQNWLETQARTIRALLKIL